MIVTDKFVFIHLHKSGGTFVSEFLLRFFPTARRIGYHYPRSRLPLEAGSLPILGTVRNPWSFYVSYFAFQHTLLTKLYSEVASLPAQALAHFQQPGIDPLNGLDVLFEVLSDKGACGFVEFTRHLLQLGSSEGRLQEVLVQMPVVLNQRRRGGPVQPKGFRGMNVTREQLATIRDTGWGFYTFLFHHLYGDGQDVHFIQMESLRQQLSAFLEQMGVTPDQAMTAYLQHAPAENVSKHDSYAHYYTPALAQVVGQQDANLSARFGYTFENAPIVSSVRSR